MHCSDNDICLIYIGRQLEVLCPDFVITLCGVFLDKTDKILQFTGRKLGGYNVYPEGKLIERALPSVCHRRRRVGLCAF